GGWQLARPLEEITLLAIYEALERPTLFAIGSRGRHPECRIEGTVNAALAETMQQAESLLMERFGQVRLDQLMPSQAKALPQACGSALPAEPSQTRAE
ncbi:MAG TPA: Rrf2 family transcriptional regulator, partial [Rhizobium sp.]|nr:Rrf2 family transcriptional regulator [Rhizobium sp.]